MSKNQGKVGTHQVVSGSGEPPDENHRKMVKTKMMEALTSFGQSTNNMDVEGIEKKIYEKVMRETKTKEQYNQIIQQLMASLRKKTELAKMNAGQQAPPGQQQQFNQQQQQQTMQQQNNPQMGGGPQQQQGQGMAQHLRPQVPPHMAQQLIGGPNNNVQQNQQQQPRMVSVSGQQMMMNPNQMGQQQQQQQMMTNQGPQMMGHPPGQQMMPNQGGPQQMMGNHQMMGPGMVQLGPPMNQQQQMSMSNQDPMSALKTMAPDTTIQQQRMRMPGPPPPPGHLQQQQNPNIELRPAFSPQNSRFNNPNSPQVGQQWTPGQGSQGMAPSPRPPMMGQGGPMSQGPPSNQQQQQHPTGMSPMPAYFNNSLNTPASIQMGNSPSVPSPGPPPPQHQQQYVGTIGPGPGEPDRYMLKLQELAKYIEPLRNMIQRIQADSSKAESKELAKIRQLHQIISNNGNNRVDMATLFKCEEALDKMNLKMKSNHDQRLEQQLMHQQQQMMNQQQQQSMSSQNVNNLIGGNMCQPLLDAFKEGLKKPNFSSFLSKTFGPPVAALGITSPVITNGSSSDAAVGVLTRKRKFVEEEENEASVSTLASNNQSADKLDSTVVIEGEIARLDSKFKVQPDPLSHPSADRTQVIATLDSVDLPYVPPVIISIPSTYPNHPPTLMIEDDSNLLVNPFNYSSVGSDDVNAKDGKAKEEEEVEPIPFGLELEDQFFKRVSAKLDMNLSKLPKLHSLTSLLQTWEMSVRQACR